MSEFHSLTTYLSEKLQEHLAEGWREYGGIMRDLISTQFFFSEEQSFVFFLIGNKGENK